MIESKYTDEGSPNILNALRAVEDPQQLTEFYFNNVDMIYEYNNKTIDSYLAGKDSDALLLLRAALINRIMGIFTEYATKTVCTPTSIENICQDIHTLVHCNRKQIKYGLNKIFQNVEEPAPQAEIEPQGGVLPTPLSETTATLQSVTRVADLKIGLLSVIQNIEAYRLATDNKISTLTYENKRLVAVNEQQARKITELEIVKPCPHANTINNLTNEIAKFQSKLHTLNSAKHQKGPKIQQASGSPLAQLGTSAPNQLQQQQQQQQQQQLQQQQQQHQQHLLPQLSLQSGSTILNATPAGGLNQTSNGAIPQQQPPPLGQLPPPPQAQNSNNGIKRGPKSVDHIFIKNVDPREDCVTIGDHIHQWSGIEREHIVVEFQFIRNNNKAFKITVPHGKMQETINVLGTEIKAEPYKDRNHRSTTNGQARGPRWNNTYRSKSLNSFRGPPPTRGPPSRRFNGRPSNWGYATPEWRGWNYPHFY